MGEAIDCVTFPQAGGSEGSLWIRLLVEDWGPRTLIESEYKAAGAEEGGGLRCATNSSFMSCCLYITACLTLSCLILTHSPPSPL